MREGAPELTVYLAKPFTGGGRDGARRWRVDALTLQPLAPGEPSSDAELLTYFEGARDRQERLVPMATLRSFDLQAGLEAALPGGCSCVAA